LDASGGDRGGRVAAGGANFHQTAKKFRIVV